MKVKVLKPFIDKQTKVLNEVGSIIELTEVRVKEILKIDNFIEIIKTSRTKKEVEENK